MLQKIEDTLRCIYMIIFMVIIPAPVCAGVAMSFSIISLPFVKSAEEVNNVAFHFAIIGVSVGAIVSLLFLFLVVYAGYSAVVLKDPKPWKSIFFN